MAEIKGYLLTEEEEKACTTLVKKLRERKVFSVDFSGCLQIKATNHEEANDIFWEWVEDWQDKSLTWSNAIGDFYLESEGVEEE